MKSKSITIVMLAAGLVAGAAMPVAAQAERVATPATFTASSVLSGEYVEGAAGTQDGAPHIRADFQTTWTATDARASGLATFRVDRVEHPGAIAHSGTWSLENEGGSWAGTFSGHWDGDGVRYFNITADGLGGYDGWTMLVTDVCVCSTPPGTSEATGVIVPGHAPSEE